ncbi:hypothetical protein JG688_00015549, partial [Phytophthora aleatoria]
AASALHGAPQTQTLSTTVAGSAVVVVKWSVQKWLQTEAAVAPTTAARTARAHSAVVNTATAEWGRHGATTTPTPSTMEESAPLLFSSLKKLTKRRPRKLSMSIQSIRQKK